MDKRKTIISGIVFLLLCLVAAWGFGLIGGTDAAVAKLQQISTQMADNSLPQDLRDQLRDQFRDQMRSLTDSQRQAFFNANSGQWQARSAQRMDEFFALPKSDQQKKLDDILNRMNQAQANQGQQPGGGSGGQGANNGGRGGGRGSMTEAQREERSKRRLDNTTPKTRAQFAEFHRLLDQRAQQRGIKLNNNWMPRAI